MHYLIHIDLHHQGKGGADPKQVQELRDKLREAKTNSAEMKARVKQLEADMKRGGLASAGGGGAGDADVSA